MMRKNSTTPDPNEAKTNRRKRSSRRVMMVVAMLSVAGLSGLAIIRSDFTSPRRQSPLTGSASSADSDRKARQLSYEVVGAYPHDSSAFLQGLVWHDGGFYESTGLEGHSTVRRVEFPSAKIVKSISLASDVFGEGLTLVDNRLIQLTWKSHLGFVYDRETFALLREFSYDTEGWGITYDGTNLIMSDGSSVLTHLDPGTFQPGRKLQVTMNERPLSNLNELEFIEGEIWANVWRTDVIVRIDPKSGRVGSFLDLSGILPPGLRNGNEDVLNGIAYDKQAKRVFVSGKLWSRIFEIRVK